MKLLKRLLPAQDVDALLGDIAEEAARRSRLWYWSQLLAVFIVGSWRDIRTHKALALRACAVGFVLFLLMAPFFSALRQVLPRYWPRPYSWGFYVTLRVLSIAAVMALGWIVVHLHRAHGLTMLLAFRVAWMLTTVAVFLWYGMFAAFQPDYADRLSSLAGQLPSVVIQNFVIGSFWMLAGGYFATKRA